jgi:7-alpha-hydroxysteroid dehydrogenase
MLARPGASVINILSPGSYKATRGNLAYYVSKAALQHLTKLMAADLGPKIRVNGIIPGPIETPALKKMISERPEVRDSAMRSIQMRRMGQPEDVAAAAVFLASSAASFITGALLPVTGGEIDGSQNSPDL